MKQIIKESVLLNTLKNFCQEDREKIEDALKTWEQSGLLEGLNEESKSIVSICLERAAKYLLAEDCPIEDGIVNVIAFPAIRRVLGQEINLQIDVPKFLSELATDFKKEKPKLKNIPGIDTEAAFLAKWCENYVQNNSHRRKALNEELSRLKVLSGIK